MVHLIPDELQAKRFPAIYKILHSDPSSPEHYTLPQMMFWASWPYAVWQLSYHIFISVRRADKIAAGSPTSFTWLRKTYSKSMAGKLVLSLPESMQEFAYMTIQYVYALATMLPCPIWFWSRWASAAFLLVVFSWSIWNGATYYIDVFGQRFSRELDQLKKDVAKWQNTPDLMGKSGLTSPHSPHLSPESEKTTSTKTPSSEATKTEKILGSVMAMQEASTGEASQTSEEGGTSLSRNTSINQIPLLDESAKTNGTGADTPGEDDSVLKMRSTGKSE